MAEDNPVIYGRDVSWQQNNSQTGFNDALATLNYSWWKTGDIQEAIVDEFISELAFGLDRRGISPGLFFSISKSIFIRKTTGVTQHKRCIVIRRPYFDACLDNQLILRTYWGG